MGGTYSTLYPKTESNWSKHLSTEEVVPPNVKSDEKTHLEAKTEY